MSREYVPDSWVILKISEDPKDTFYKVLAGWSGGYLDGDSWQLNSGITEVESSGNYYKFHGNSGSIYRCHKRGEGLRMNIAGIYTQLKNRHGEAVSLVSMSDSLDFTKNHG